jgi:hypothetical protein
MFSVLIVYNRLANFQLYLVLVNQHIFELFNKIYHVNQYQDFSVLLVCE